MNQPAIIDSNVLVSGILSKEKDSPLSAIVDKMLSGELPFLLSPQLLSEYRNVPLRPKIVQLHGLTEEEIDKMLEEIALDAIWREPQAAAAAPDPGDDHLWALMSAVPGSILVTGDQLLLKNPPPGASVLSPRSYMELKKW
ncbi:MAG: PIN domain-containing protein [Syntrophales bacterium]|jgi:predicted nucleic acid-binding protein|nr:PIN domain-containing protein [Syntrophales bacterium]MDY0045051.1 PIN domain-containing protein [Syntrophales bacterium]